MHFDAGSVDVSSATKYVRKRDTVASIPIVQSGQTSSSHKKKEYSHMHSGCVTKTARSFGFGLHFEGT
jgi:hypothetical protein